MSTQADDRPMRVARAAGLVPLALRGDLKKGLPFRGAGRLAFGREVRPVRDVVELLLDAGALAPPANA